MEIEPKSKSFSVFIHIFEKQPNEFKFIMSL